MEKQKKHTKKSKADYPGISRLFELLQKNRLTGAQFTLMFDATREDPENNPLLSEQQIYISQLVITGWIQEDRKTLTDKGVSLFQEAEKLFKGAGKTVMVDLAMVEQYNLMFPAIKIPTSGKYARTNIRELAEAFGKFFLKYPEYHNWETVFGATDLYVREFEAKNWEYARTNKYFIAKANQDKTVNYEIANYCQRFLEGEKVEPFTFNEKIV